MGTNIFIIMFYWLVKLILFLFLQTTKNSVTFLFLHAKAECTVIADIYTLALEHLISTYLYDFENRIFIYSVLMLISDERSSDLHLYLLSIIYLKK